MLRLLEEGASAALVSRASGLSLEDILALPVKRRIKVADSEELSEAAAQLAWMAIEAGMEILETGSPAMKMRLVTSIASHPLRRMQTAVSKERQGLMNLFDLIMAGPSPVEDDEEEIELPTDSPD